MFEAPHHATSWDVFSRLKLGQSLINVPDDYTGPQATSIFRFSPRQGKRTGVLAEAMHKCVG